MENKVVKKESNFVDNIAYKSKFQFRIWVNDYIICQRYFKINGFNEESIYTKEFADCMNGIVTSIQNDLESKSRVFMWYTNMKEPFKLQGFINYDDFSESDTDFLKVILSNKIEGDIESPDGRVVHKEFMNYPENLATDFGDNERPEDGEITFKFSFLVDDAPIFEKIWDGNVYPKFVRNGVDLTNMYAVSNKWDISSLSFGAAIVRYMQGGKINLISDFIKRICDTLSNTFTDKYDYTKNMPPYKDNNHIDEDAYKAAIEYYGVIKPIVTGHTDIDVKTKNYTYFSSFESYKRSWRKSVYKKTKKYFENLY